MDAVIGSRANTHTHTHQGWPFSLIWFAMSADGGGLLKTDYSAGKSGAVRWMEELKNSRAALMGRKWLIRLIFELYRLRSTTSMHPSDAGMQMTPAHSQQPIDTVAAPLPHASSTVANLTNTTAVNMGTRALTPHSAFNRVSEGVALTSTSYQNKQPWYLSD